MKNLSYALCLCSGHYQQTKKNSTDEGWAKLTSAAKSLKRLKLQTEHVNVGDSRVMRVYSAVNDHEIEEVDFLGEDEDGFEVYPEKDEETESILVDMAELCKIPGNSPGQLVTTLMREFDFFVHEDSPTQLQAWNNKLPAGWDGKAGIKLGRSRPFRRGQMPDCGESASYLQYMADTSANTKSGAPKVKAPRTCSVDGCGNGGKLIEGKCRRCQPECEAPGYTNRREFKISEMCKRHHKEWKESAVGNSVLKEWKESVGK